MQEERNERVVVVYERVSTEKQDLSRQAVQRGRAAADYPGREIRVIQDDGVSAYKTPIFDRPGGAELVALIEAGQAEAVYADAQDRLSRGRQSEWWRFADLCLDNGTRIVIDGRELRLDEEADEIRSAIDAILARRESREKGHRVKGGLRKRRSDGLYVGGIPYGYRSERDHNDKNDPGRLIVVEHEAGVVRRMHRAYLAGDGFLKIARTLNDQGVPSPTGKTWTNRVVARTIGKPVYAGLLSLDDDLIESSHEPIVDRETFERVQALREARNAHKQGKGRQPKRHLLDVRLLRCSCGRGMSPHRDHYRCVARANGEACAMPSPPRTVIDEQILQHFLSLRHDYAATIAAVTAEATRQVTEARALLDESERQVAEAEAGRDRAVRAFLDGKIGDAAYELALERATSEQQAAEAEALRLRQRLDELEAELAAIDSEEEVAQRLQAIREAVAGRVAEAEGIASVRAALTQLFDHFGVEHVGPKEWKITPHLRHRTAREGRRRVGLAATAENGQGPQSRR